MYIERGTPGIQHLSSGSPSGGSTPSPGTDTVARCSKLLLFLASASGRYGMTPPSTMLWPPGCAPQAPTSSVYGPAAAECASRSQLAVVTLCQMPLKSGLPSAVRCAV